MTATVAVTHVSLNEVVNDAAAAGAVTSLTASLVVSAEPDKLLIKVARLEGPGLTTQVFGAPLVVGEYRFSLDLNLVGDLHGAAILWDGDVVTLRISIAADDNLFGPLGNRLLSTDAGDWLIRVSGDVFANLVRRQLQDALKKATKPPTTLTIEQPASAYWVPPFAGWTWGVEGSAELEKKNACAGVDLSITINVSLSVSPDIATKQVALALRVSSDVSDWDVFRCWLLVGGIASVLLGIATNVVEGLILAISSLVMLGEMVRVDAGDEVKSQDVGSMFKEVDHDETSITYAGSIKLPMFPEPAGSVNQAVAGPDGLIVWGYMTLGGIHHDITFDPDGGHLPGVWSSGYSCSQHRWETSYDVWSVVVRDIVKAFGAAIGQNAVTVFPTSGFRAVEFMPVLHEVTAMPGYWVIDAPPRPMASPMITPRRTAPPPEGEHLYFFLHTSAGLRRYEIGPVEPVDYVAGAILGQARPERSVLDALGQPVPEPLPPRQHGPPTPAQLGLYEANCRQLTLQWTRPQQMRWLVDPPPVDYGIRPLRQWMLSFRNLPPNSRVTIHQHGAGHERPVVHTFPRTEGVLEIVTQADAEVSIEHELDRSDAEVRVEQRWLIPTRVERLPAPAQSLALARSRGRLQERQVTVRAGEKILMLTAAGLVPVDTRPTSKPDRHQVAPLSLSLPAGQVAAVVKDQLVVAIPWKGAKRGALP